MTLGAVECAVGLFEQGLAKRLGLTCAARCKAGLLCGHPYADREVLGGDVAGKVERVPGDDAAQARCDPLGGCAGCFGHQNEKLLATDPGHKVFAADILLQHTRKRHQRRISCGVAKLIIDAFEVINIDQHNRKWVLVALGELYFSFEMYIHSCAIAYAC